MRTNAYPRKGSKAVAHVLLSVGARRLPFEQGTSRQLARWLGIVFGLVCIVLMPFVTAQTAPSPSHRDLKGDIKKGDTNKDKRAVPADAKALPDPPVLAAPPPSIDQTPPRPPVIAWDGKQLTIDAENATLSSILLGIRSRTGASIEMPESTSAERVAAHLGPAPIREVLSALLYGTNFNYIIQASERDELGLGKLILSPRDSDKSDGVVASDSQKNSNIRLMPGYSAPGKRDFEVSHETAGADAPDAEQPGASDAAVSNPESNQVVNAESASTTAPPSGAADSQPASANSDSADAAPPADAGFSSSGQTVSQNTAPMSSVTMPTPGEAAPLSQMEQNLQNMYQQRRQLQAQQNHAVPAQAN